MNRKAMIKFINNEVLPGAEIATWEWQFGGREIFWEILKGIEKWRVGKPANIQMKGQIIDGVLYLNGEAVKRVSAKLRRVPYSSEAEHWENRILERQEVIE